MLERVQIGLERDLLGRVGEAALRRTMSDAASAATSPIALCRCMNIPARYCTGHLGDIGVPPESFKVWTEEAIEASK